MRSRADNLDPRTAAAAATIGGVLLAAVLVQWTPPAWAAVLVFVACLRELVRIRERRADQVRFEEVRARATELEKVTSVRVESAPAGEMRNAGDLLAHVSHEIRTPATGIVGLARLLQDTELSEEQGDFVRTLHDSAESLITLLDDVLDFSKIEAGKLELEERPFDLKECMQGVVDLLLPKATEKGLEFVCDLSVDLPSHLVGDAGRLRQVLLNLVGNAIKFTLAGEIELGARLIERRSDELELEFFVRDTGIGIADDVQSRLFQPFTQADAGIARSFGGTGLGLAISRELAHAMGGELSCESKEREGSTFRLQAIFGPAPQDEPAAIRSLEGLRVMIVAESAAQRACVARHLDCWGASVVADYDGEAVLDHLREMGDRNDVVLVDSDLRSTDAFRLVRTIRGDASLAEVRIVLVKALRCQFTAQRLMRMGFDAWVRKPVWPDELHEALALLCEDAESVQPAEEPDAERNELPFLDLAVLLVEDNQVNQKVASLLLSKLGCATDVVCNGQDAVEKAASKRYDLILMDCQMPVMDGFDATRAIRGSASKEHRSVPVIAMTASNDVRDKARCEEAGMDGFLTKPVLQDDLRAALERWGASRPADSTPDERAHTTPMNDDSILNREVIDSLRELSDGDDALLRELVDLFLSDTPTRLDDLAAALASGDANGVEAAAHALKSSSGNIGAQRLADLCRQIEALGREERLDSVPGLVDNSRGEFQMVQQALEDELAG